MLNEPPSQSFRARRRNPKSRVNLSEEVVQQASRLLSLPRSTAKSLIAGRASERLARVVLALVEVRPCPVADHDLLRGMGLAVVSARGYELAFAVDRTASKATGAAASWRAAGKHARALAVISKALDLDLPATDRAPLLTVAASCLTDLGDLLGARSAAMDALDCASPNQRDYPQRVLSRIAGRLGRTREAAAREDEANVIEGHRHADRDGSSHAAAKARMQAAISVPQSPLYAGFLEKAEDARQAYRNDYLPSAHWQETRRRVLKRAGGHCEQCEASSVLDVHHTTYWRRGCEDIDADLVALCRTCHAAEHDLSERARGAIREAMVRVGAT